MRRLGHAFEEIVSKENLFLAYKEARKGKVKYRQVKRFEAHLDRNIERLRKKLIAGKWEVWGYRQFEKRDGEKIRKVDWDPCFVDNIVQHAIEQVAGRYLIKSGIEDTYAGIKKRGIHKGVERMILFIQSFEGRPFYVLKMDAKKYYQNIDHDILKQMIRLKIKDKDVLKLLDKIIDSHFPGLPIGNYLSQLLANYYLSQYDRFVKDSGFRCYSRYCDDIVILHEDKNKLRDLLRETEYWFTGMRLTIKKNVQIFPFERDGLDYLGYIFTYEPSGGQGEEARGIKVYLRRTTETKYYRASSRFQKRPSEKNSRPLSSYWGWFKWLTRGDRLWHSNFDCSYKKLHAKTKKTGGKKHEQHSQGTSNVLPQ